MCSYNKIQKFKKKMMCIFCSSRNCQALLGMPDMAVLNIINLNIDSIQAEIMNCKTNRGKETHTVVEGCTNRDTCGIIKQEANNQNGQNHSNKLIDYFYS